MVSLNGQMSCPYSTSLIATKGVSLGMSYTRSVGNNRGTRYVVQRRGGTIRHDRGTVVDDAPRPGVDSSAGRYMAKTR